MTAAILTQAFQHSLYHYIMCYVFTMHEFKKKGKSNYNKTASSCSTQYIIIFVRNATQQIIQIIHVILDMRPQPAPPGKHL